MSVLKKLAGEAALYGMSSILGRMLNYMLVPFYTAMFAPAEYGIITKLYAFVAFFNVIYTFGMETSYFRFASREPKESQHYYELAFTTVTSISLSISAFLVFFATPIAVYLDVEGQELFIGWLAITMALDGIVSIPFARLRLEKNARKFVTIRMANIGLNIFFNLLFVYFAPKMAAGVFGGSFKVIGEWLYRPEIGVGYVFLANMLANAFIFILLRRELLLAQFRTTWQYLQPMLVYAYPILLMGLAGMTSEMLGRIALEKWLPNGFYEGRTAEEALGIYGACYKLSIFMQLAIQAFKYAAEPFFFSQSSDKNAPELFAVVMKWFIVACMFIFLSISLNLAWIAPIFLRQEAYLEGLIVVPILLIANMFLGIYYNLTAWFKLTDKTYYGTWLSTGGAVATLVLNFALIPIAGYTGSAIATLICYAGMALVCYYLGQKYYPIPYDLRSALFHICLASLLVAMGWETQKWPMGMHVMAIITLMLAYIGAILFIERDTIAAIRKPK